MPRARLISAAALACALVILVVVLVARGDSDSSPNVAVQSGSVPEKQAKASKPPRASTTTVRPTTTTTTIPHDPARSFAPTLVRTIGGDISPKSVVASNTGLVFAQNMMYRHSVTVYDQAGSLVKTIPDSVDLAKFGVAGHPGVSQGAPVEAAVDAVGRNMFVTNYSMYGANFGPEGSDECGGPSGLSPSYTYRINLKKLAIDGVAQVGMVPKYVAVTPDDKYVLTTNWCSYDMSVTDYKTLKELRRVPLGAYPRGIAVDSTGRNAYVAVMGSRDIARVDLRTFAVSWFRNIGTSPRHLVLSPDDSRLYVTLNGDGRVAAIDTSTGQVVGAVATGSQPRSMTISDDGRALYVVNYSSNTMSVLRASDLGIVKTIAVGSNPIGIAYEPVAHRLWVASYAGEILVYDA
jgi:YVTN family beta-propeller protein